MSEAKPFASLSSGLLARKGAAKPAMRPQGFGQMGAGLDDLGWNDMGFAAPQPQPAAVASWDERRPTPAALTPPPVLRQQEELVASFAAPPAARVADNEQPVPAVPERVGGEEARASAVPEVAPPERVLPTKTPVARRAPGAKPKAAFTLRLDQERHLRLRLACAVTHRSAQALVTDAVDAYLSGLPDVEALAGQVPPRRATSA